MEESGLFVIFFNALEAFGAGVAGTGPFFFQAAAEHGDGLPIGGNAVEDRPEAFGGHIEATIFPKGVADVEVIVGIGVVAVEGFEKVSQRFG